MPEKKNQHFVPKVHLRQFSTDVLQRKIDIWLPKHDKVVIGASIKDQCSKPYFYGKDLAIENALNSPERMLGQILKNLRDNRELSQNVLQKLLFLWLLQHLRAEKSIRDHKLAMAMMSDKIRLGGDNQENINKYIGKPLENEEIAEMTLSEIKIYFEGISDLKAVFLINKTKKGFIISDNPAVSSNKLILKRFMNYRNWGISSAGLYLFMPLSPKIGLFAYDKYVYELHGRSGIKCNLKERDVVELNKLLYLFSDNLIVFPPECKKEDFITDLKKFSDAKPESLVRVNVAVKDKSKANDGYVEYVTTSDEDFGKAEMGLIHLESVPPIVPRHFSKLKIRQFPRYIDTRSGAGLQRWNSSKMY